MSAPAVRVTTPADEASAVDTIVLAFAADPVARWCWRDARQYLAHIPDFTRAFGGRAFANGTAHCTADGSGAALLSFALAECDRDHFPAYLESTNPRNVSLYKRHGFEELGTIQVGQSPPLVPMLRRAR